jgi:hypothetical protein
MSGRQSVTFFYTAGVPRLSVNLKQQFTPAGTPVLVARKVQGSFALL